MLMNTCDILASAFETRVRALGIGLGALSARILAPSVTVCRSDARILVAPRIMCAVQRFSSAVHRTQHMPHRVQLLYRRRDVVACMPPRWMEACIEVA